MDDAKKVYREGEAVVKEAVREVDGHDIGDDVGNAGDQIRKGLGNAGDTLRQTGDDIADEAERVKNNP